VQAASERVATAVTHHDLVSRGRATLDAFDGLREHPRVPSPHRLHVTCLENDRSHESGRWCSAISRAWRQRTSDRTRGVRFRSAHPGLGSPDRTKTGPIPHPGCALSRSTPWVRSPVGCGRWVPQPCNRILTAGAFSGICEPISAGERWHWGCYSCRTSPLSSKENLGLDAASSRVCPFFHPDGARPGDFGGCAGRLPGRLVLRAERLAAGFALIGAAPRAAATRPVAAATRHAAAATRRATPGWSVGRSAGLWPSILSIA